jgi:ABC-type nitrate/sulfonate/bicarbonate transport system ATPase subunit
MSDLTATDDRAVPKSSSGARGDPPVVSVQGVSYAYDKRIAVLDDLSLDVFGGEIVSVVGPSGCGKSTLLRLIAGISEPTAGAIVRNDGMADGRRPLTMVFQGDTLLPWLTVTDNAALYSRFQSHTCRRAEAAERKRRISELVDLVGLARFAKAYPYQLSGGMRRRLAFIAAVAPLPRILLLDEPFASVDEPTRIQIHHDILRIIRRLDMTVIIVTHDLGEAASLSDRVVMLTSRPAGILSQHRIPFGRDRDVIALRQSPQFLDVYAALWHDLGLQLGSGRRVD